MKRILLPAAVLLASSTSLMAEPLRLGMSPEPYMPATMIDSSGTWIGYEADISNDVCAALADGCEIKPMAWEALLTSLQSGKVDFVVGAFSITEERLQVVDFSIPYQIPTTHLVGPKSDTTEIKTTTADDGKEVLSAEGLDGKIIGAQSASIQSAYLAKFTPTLEVKDYPAADNVVSDLLAGRIDYAMLGDGFIETFLATPDGADYEIKKTMPNHPSLGDGIGYAVRKGDTATLEAINAPLQAMADSGKLKEYLDKWAGRTE